MNLFAYGSLIFPEVLEALADRRFAYEDTAIADFERRALVGKPYPGLRETLGFSVEGRLWFDIDAESMGIIDKFEDSCYDRRTISVNTRSRGIVEAQVYVVPASLESGLSELAWEISEFENRHLAEYVLMCRRFRGDVLAAALD